MNTLEKMQRYVMPTYARFPLVPVKAAGSYVWDEAGKKYLDFCSGVAVCSLGHCHPALQSAISKQAAEMMHVSNLFQIPQQAELAELIVEKFVKIPGKIFFSNSGAEANDGLIKAARRFGHKSVAADGTARYEVITFTQSFHGRTLGSMAATGQKKIQEGFDPLLPGFKYCPLNDLEKLSASIEKQTAAILLEPVQGEGGVNSVSPEFLRGVAELCKKHDLLFLLDEVQTGFGRCGTEMAWRTIAPERKPDGISWAKGMGGGFPIGAFYLSDRLIDDGKEHGRLACESQTNTGETPVLLSNILSPGSHGSTYGGSPLACAAAMAVLQTMQQENICENVLAREAQVRKTFADWQQNIFSEIKGKGLLLGFAIRDGAVTPPEGKTPAQFIVAKLMEHGLLTVPAGPNVLRWLPPLNVSEGEIDEAFAVMKEVASSM